MPNYPNGTETKTNKVGKLHHMLWQRFDLFYLQTAILIARLKQLSICHKVGMHGNGRQFSLTAEGYGRQA